jgi:peptidoglycan/LPS O-acetylase OafA/YrhL
MKSPAFLKWIQNLRRGWLYLIYLSTILLFFFKHLIFYGPMGIPERLISGVLFCMILLEQNFCRNSFFRMENYKVLNWLGKYTYGMYCLHFIALLIQIRIGHVFGFTSQWWTLLFGPLLGMALTIGLALASYYLYERRFLQLKDRFAFVTRGGK